MVAFIYGTNLVSERKSLEAMNGGRIEYRKGERKKKVKLNSMIIAQEYLSHAYNVKLYIFVLGS